MIPDLDRIAAEQSKRVASELLQAAAQGGTEADFRREAARILEETAVRAGLTIVPRDEFSVARGRVDSVYNRLILEYKRPGVIRPTNTGKSNQVVIQQVKDYVGDVATRERREVHRLAGVATDGRHFLFVRRVGEGWSVDAPTPVTPASTERFLRLLYSLAEGAALVPENLVNDFGPKHDRARRAVRAIYRGLSSSRQPLVGKLFEQWRTFFAEATDYREWSERLKSKPEFESFVKSLWTKEEIKHLEPARVFFVLHTYYALLIKLVASMAAARFVEGSSTSLSSLASLEGENLRGQLRELEDGGLFRHYGIRNFLEGDFFGWYLSGWNHDIEDGVRDIVKRLAEYDPGTLELAPENARDLLKKLYHYLLPREIRHDLGEYYTPDWLAERLIRQTMGTRDLGDPTKRVLDPACGSGTFLVLLINHARRGAQQRNLGPQKTLDLIRQNIVGFDLNPLAVIAARTNYLLALGDLVREAKRISPEGIDIPVYQCDSIVLPEPSGDLLEQGYPLPTSVGTFRVPVKFATRERMEVLANILDECVATKTSDESFLTRLSQAADMFAQDLNETKDALLVIYRRLRDLHDEGLNGVWARIIKNGFAPLFVGRFEFVVGNPPWVNWESLPDEYRLRTKPLWERYGLFPHGGMDTILGKGKKDLSMLMTYVAVDSFLLNGGKIGFVLSQSLLKTSGAGQGFRRFQIDANGKAKFAPIAVDDMVRLNPFEGASNRTVVVVFQKGAAIRFPVVYQVWKKRTRGRGAAIGFDTPYEEVTTQKVATSTLYAQPIDKRDITSSWITAKRRALRALRKMLGPSGYTAHEGCNTGGANGVFWVTVVGKRPGGLVIVSNLTEGAKRKVPRIQSAVETGLLYPLLRGRDISRWSATSSAHIVLSQDAKARQGIPQETMEREYPKTLAYLTKFKSALGDRKDRGTRGIISKGGPWWSIFGVSDYTLSPWKVVWRELGHTLDAAVIGSASVITKSKPIVPDHTCILVDFSAEDEAHYFCAMVNSSPSRLAIQNYIVLHPDPHVLDNVRIPKFNRKDRLHRELAALSQRAHASARDGEETRTAAVEAQIDDLAAAVWELTKTEIGDIQESLEEA